VSHLSRLLLEALETHGEVRLLRDPNSVRLAIVAIIEEELRRDEYIERRVRQKITSQQHDIPEGGGEWDILYRQYYREEFDRYRPVR
jgi:hypothetical protein